MTTPLARLSLAAIHAEIRRRTGGLKGLERKRARLSAKLDRLDQQIEELGGVISRRGRGIRHGGRGSRVRNEMTLMEALKKAIGSKTMTVPDAVAAVQKAGYRTHSNNFRTQVNIALIKGPFKRVGRGEYAAK
jgi:hypothetical protein